jgi:hypothetical protein
MCASATSMNSPASVPSTSRPSARLTRDADGVWVGIDARGESLIRLAPGWGSRLPVSFAAEHQPRRPLAVRSSSP